MDEPLEPLALKQPETLGEFTVRVDVMPYDNTDNPINLYVATGWIEGDKEIPEGESVEDGMGRVEFRMMSSDLKHAAGKCIANLVNYVEGLKQDIKDSTSPIEPPKAEEGETAPPDGLG